MKFKFRTITDNAVLQAAMVGLLERHTRIVGQIDHISSLLGQKEDVPQSPEKRRESNRRYISIAGRKRIGAAARKRWKAFRAAKARTEGEGRSARRQYRRKAG